MVGEGVTRVWSRAWVRGVVELGVEHGDDSGVLLGLNELLGVG